MSLEDADIGAEHESQDEIKQLKKDYIGKNSKISYRYSLIIFLFYIFKFDKHIMHKSWIRILKTYDMMENEKAKEMKVKKMIRKLIQRADQNCPPIDFDTYEPAHFLKYLLALQNSDGKRFGASTYNSGRSALHHLYTLYGKKQGTEFKEDMGLLFKSFKRKITEEKQDGDGRIQTGKSPISFNLCKKINQYMLKEQTTESVFARVLMNITWNLICRSKNTTTIHLHHIELTEDCLSIYFAHMKNDQTGCPCHLFIYFSYRLSLIVV